MVTGDFKLSKESQRFLDSGQCGQSNHEKVIKECDLFIRKYAQEDLAKATVLAGKLIENSRSFSKELYSVALRTYGWIKILEADFKEAKKAYLKARSLTSADASARARIDRILIDVYMHLGDIPESRKRARNAIKTFRRIEDYDGEAKTRINYANSYHRQDRHADALRIYEKVIKHYKKGNDQLTLGTCFYNCANSYVQLLNFYKGEEYYRNAEKSFASIGYDLYVNEARYGRAWLEKLRGNYHTSLRALAECESYYRKVGQPKGVTLCNLDRAEVMLELQLVSDARTLAMQAEKSARKLNLVYESGKASLFLAKASFAMGMNNEAKKALNRSKKDFSKGDNKNMLAVTKFYELIYLKKSHTTKDFEKLRKELNNAQLPLWAAVCDLTRIANAENRKDKKCLANLRKNRAVQTVPQLYASWQTLLGDIALDDGKKLTAKQRWNKAAEALDRMRVNIPPVDVRHSIAEYNLDPHKRMLSASLKDNPKDAAIWSERCKLAGIWSHSDLIPDSEDRKKVNVRLNQLAKQVTALSTSLEKSRGESVPHYWSSYSSYKNIQSQVRRNILTLDGEIYESNSIHDEVRRLLEKHSARNPIVQFHSNEKDLYGFIHYKGKTRVVKYEESYSSIARFSGQWNILLGEMLQRGKKVRLSDKQEELRLLRQLGEWLWKPLEISNEFDSISIIPTGRMTSLPWSAFLVDNKHLVDIHALSLSPSIRHYDLSSNGVIESLSAEILVGDTTGLKNTSDEILSVSMLDNVNTNVISPCRRDDWPEVKESLIWHYIGHAQFRGDNPFYSSLSLVDGPLFAADFRLRKSNVALVTLAACRTGIQSSLPNYESTGLVRALFEMGAKNIIASHWPVNNQATVDWMKSFYDMLNQGKSLHEAVRQSTLEMKSIYPCAGQWAAFSLFGSGKGFKIDKNVLYS